jgi:Ca2+-binding EF-hand superfamily protein
MNFRYLFATALVAISAGASAQTLPNRPIQRSEIIAAAKRQFALLDANHDGVVTQAEFARFRDSAAGRAASANTDPFQHVGGHWMDHADPNGTGRVTLDMAEQHPLQLFDQADLNHDGVLGLDELKLARAMMALTSR